MSDNIRIEKNYTQLPQNEQIQNKKPEIKTGKWETFKTYAKGFCEGFAEGLKPENNAVVNEMANTGNYWINGFKNSDIASYLSGNFKEGFNKNVNSFKTMFTNSDVSHLLSGDLEGAGQIFAQSDKEWETALGLNIVKAPYKEGYKELKKAVDDGDNTKLSKAERAVGIIGGIGHVADDWTTPSGLAVLPLMGAGIGWLNANAPKALLTGGKYYLYATGASDVVEGVSGNIDAKTITEAEQGTSKTIGGGITMMIGKSLKGKPKVPASKTAKANAVEPQKAEVKPTEAEIQKIKEKEHFKEVFDGIERDNREAAIDFQDRLRIFKRNRKPVEPVKAETKAETKPIEVKNTEVKPVEIIEPKAETTYAEAAVTDAKTTVEGAKVEAQVKEVKSEKGKIVVKKKYFDLTSEKLLPRSKHHPLFDKTGELSEDGVALVHMTDYFPKTGKILSDREAFCGTRSSVHTTVNHAVKSVNIETSDWSNKKYAIIMPFKQAVSANSDGKFIAGMTADLWTNGSLRLPKGTIIVRQSKKVPKGKLRIVNAEQIEKFKNLKGVKIAETSELPHTQVKIILEKIGYQPIEPSSMFGGLGECSICNQLSKEMEIWNRFTKRYGIIPSLHDATPSAILEKLIDGLVKTPAIKGYPLQVIKDNKVVFDHKKTILDIISACKSQSKKTGLPISFDIDLFEREVIRANSFSDIYNSITKKLKLKSISRAKQVKDFGDILTNGAINSTGIINSYCLNFELASSMQKAYSNPSIENMENFVNLRNLDRRSVKTLLDENITYVLKKYKAKVEEFFSDIEMSEEIRPKFIWVE